MASMPAESLARRGGCLALDEALGIGTMPRIPAIGSDHRIMKKRSPASEVEAFLAAHADVSGVEMLIPDGVGVIRGKRLARDGLAKLYEEGARIPGSIFALDVTGADVEAAGPLWEEGDADRICWPIPGTLKPVPWHSRPLGQVLLTMHNEDGTPFFADPRQVLTRVLQRYAADRLTPLM